MLAVLPGLVALRSYRRWRRSTEAAPSFAWALAIVSLGAIVLVPLAFEGFVALAIVLAIVIVPALLVITIKE